MDQIENHIFQSLRPAPDKIDEWVFEHMLALGKPTASKETNACMIWATYDKLKPVAEDHKGNYVYLNSWNSTRADYIAQNCEIPTQTIDPSKYRLPAIQPEQSDPTVFLLVFVLNLPMTDDPIPLLRKCARVLKKVRLTDDVLNAYHRSRYLLIRHYLDAHYHAVSGL